MNYEEPIEAPSWLLPAVYVLDQWMGRGASPRESVAAHQTRGMATDERAQIARIAYAAIRKDRLLAFALGEAVDALDRNGRAAAIVLGEAVSCGELQPEEARELFLRWSQVELAWDDVLRAGALARGKDGTLVLATSGAAVLDANGKKIQLDMDEADVRIDEQGRVLQGEDEVARLAVVVPDDARNLVKEGRDAMRLLGGRVNAAPDATIVRQGHLEESTVDPVLSLAELIKVSRGIEFATRLMQAEDQATGRLIQTFGRFG
jgi:hypothetical protein